MTFLRKSLAVSLGLAAAALIAPAAHAVPVLGSSIFYTGGTVVVETLPVSSGFTSELGLYDPITLMRLTSLAFPTGVIVLDEPAGIIVDITSLITDNGIVAGDELVFGIFVVNTGDTFFMGPAARNTDAILHAGVDVISPTIANVGFEDLLGGGDLDYDDNVFQFRGGVSVPEPGSLFLAGAGLLGLAYARRSKKQYKKH